MNEIINTFGPLVVFVLFIRALFWGLKAWSRYKRKAKYAGKPGMGRKKRGSHRRTRITSTKGGKIKYDQ